MTKVEFYLFLITKSGLRFALYKFRIKQSSAMGVYPAFPLAVVEFSEYETYAVRCTIWYHLHNLKLENYPCSSVTFSKVACNFTKSNTPSWVFFTFSKLYKWYQIAQSITYKIPLIFHLQPQ